MFLNWVVGYILRPGTAFAWAQRHLRFGYWWILLTVITLESVAMLYSPDLDPELRRDPVLLVLWGGTLLILLFDLQALLLLGAGRAFGWYISWPQALRFIGLAWSLVLLESAVGFIPALLGRNALLFWLSIPFGLWYTLALAAGLRRVTGFGTARALALALLASLPWQGALMWLHWNSL